MKKIFALAALTAVAVPALAQSFVPGSTGLSARVGGFFPTNGLARDYSKTWFAAGVQFKLGEVGPSILSSAYRSSYAISLDYFQKSDFRVLPVMINYVADIENVFLTAGVGVAFTRFPLGAGTSDQTRFAYTLGLGYKIPVGTVPAFIEGRFWGNEKSEANGFGLYAGVKF